MAQLAWTAPEEPRRLLLVAAGGHPPADLLAQLERRRWSVVEVASLAAAQQQLAVHPYPVVLLFAGESSAPSCEAVRACMRLAAHCEWLGVFPPGVVGSPPLRELILDCFFDYHTDPVDPEFLCQMLEHALGRALLRRLSQAEPPGGAHRMKVEKLEQIRIEADKAAVLHALARCNDNVTMAARELGISRMTLYRLVSKYEIPLRAA